MRLIIGLALSCFWFSSCGTDGPVINQDQSVQSETEINVIEKPIMSWPDLTTRPMPQPTIQVSYGETETGVVDVWMPAGEGPHPVVLMVHGGCWQKSIADRTLMNYLAESFRQEGLAVWNIEYRGVDEEGGGYPGTFEDVANAANFMMDQAERFNLDIFRVAGFGHSAGGHLITWYAGANHLPETSKISASRKIPLKGVINSGGLADLVKSEPLTLKSCLADVRIFLTGDSTLERPDPFHDTSSDRLLPTNVPVFSFNGARDRIAPSELGQAFTIKALSAGDEAQFFEIPGEGHVELIAPDTAAYEHQISILKDWLTEK